MQDVVEVLENQIWIGVTWREAFVVPFIPGTVPAWSDACFEPVEWPSSSQPCSDGDKGWCIIRSPATDADGWVYGTAFDHLREDRPGGRASKRTNDRVRSRLWRRAAEQGHAQQQQYAQATPLANGMRDASSSGGSPTAQASSPTAAGAAAVGGAAGQVASASRAAWHGAVHAVQTSMPGAVKRASFAGMVNTFLKLVKDAAARHNTVMITPDITGWFFVISTHSEELRKQQLGQLQHLVWFSRDNKLQAAMQHGGLGSNPPGVVLKGAAAALAALESSKQPEAAAGAATGAAAGTAGSAATSTAASSRDSTSSSGTASGGRHVLTGRPFNGLKMHLGGSSSSRVSTSAQQQQQQRQQQPGSSSSINSKPHASSTQPSSSPAGAAAGVELHVGHLAMLNDLLAGAQYSQAAYGYVAAAGHLSNLGNAIKMLATLPHFNAITGASLEANIRAMHTLAGFCPQDVLLAAWHNDTFRPCHYVAIDVKRGNIVLGIRGSLELGDLETDVTAAPLPYEFQGVAGWVHEGLLAAAAYVVSNTVDALAEAAQRCPGWPLVVAGHSLGGGVAALVTLLLQQPGAAPRGISGVRCITIGPPAVLSQELCGLCEEYTISIVLGADAIPRLSTFSVESLLLDLVNASLSRRVTTQLAATTTSVAASTADAINSLAAGLSRLANTATNNMVNNVNSMKSSLASFKALPSFPLIDGALGTHFLGLPGTTPAGGSTSAAGSSSSRSDVVRGLQPGDLYSTGTGSVELTRLLRLQQQQQQWQEQPGCLRDGSDGGLKQVHIMLQDDREQWELHRASLDEQQQPAGQQRLSCSNQQQSPQQQQQQPVGQAHAAASAPIRPKLGKLGLTEPPAAATELTAAAEACTAAQEALTPHAQQQQQEHRQHQQKDAQRPDRLPKAPLQAAGQHTPPAGQRTTSSRTAGAHAVQTSAVGKRPKEQAVNSSSSSGGGGGVGVSKAPGGPKLVSGGVSPANIMIFSKHDDMDIITGIQEAWAGLKPHSIAPPPAAAAAANSSSSRDSGRGQDRATAVHEQQQGRAAAETAAARQPTSSTKSSSSRSGVTPFGVELLQAAPAGASTPGGSSAALQQAAAVAAAEIDDPVEGGGAQLASKVRSSSSSSIPRSTSEPSLQQWASDGLQPLGEPSWVKVNRSCDGTTSSSNGSPGGGQPQQHEGVGGAAAGGSSRGGAAADSTVHALESDLKRTARLYPPGRIFWILSEELVGPAAHQLMTAVAAHLQPAAAATAAAAAAATAAASGSTTATATATPTTSSSAAASIPSASSHMEAPSLAQMDMPSSLMGPGSRSALRTKQDQQPHQQQPSSRQRHQQQQKQQQQQPVSSKTAARDAATAHAVAAASAKHILQDVHSLEARRAAAAALQAAQHEHPPLRLREQQSPAEAAEQLEQQLRLQQQDLQAAEAAVPNDATSPSAAASVVAGSSSSCCSSTGGSQGAAGLVNQAQQAQQKPLRTLRSPAPAAVQMTQPAAGAAGPQATAAAAGGGGTGQAPANRSSSGPMEVDGSAAGRAAGFGWPTTWGSADIQPEDLPQELQELIRILGTPCDAASALAIGYKKQVLLQHFWQQRQREASSAQASASGAAGSRRGTGSSTGSRRGRSSSDSHLMRFEDMIRAVDDPSSSSAAAAAAAGAGPVAIPQVELVDHSWWGTISSIGSVGVGGISSGSSSSQSAHPGMSAGTAGPAEPQAAASQPQASNSISGAVSAMKRALSVASHRLDSVGSAGAEPAAGPAAAGHGAAGATAQPDQPQTQAALEEPSQQEVQLSVVQQSDDYVIWAAQQAAQHQQQLEQQKQQQAAAAAAAAAAKEQMSIPELAAESLVELSHLPERIAESLGGLRLGGSSSGAEDSACSDLGPGAAGLTALCAPLLGPAADGAAAAAAPNTTSTSGLRLPPVVVMPERDVFSKLLLHRTAVLDHLPSNYVKVLTELKEAYSGLTQQPQ